MASAMIDTDHAEAFARSAIGSAQQKTASMGIAQWVQLVGGAMIVTLLVVVVLNNVWTSVNVGSGPFNQTAGDLQTTGQSALGLLIVGLIVVAAKAIMSYFGNGGGGF